MEGSVKMLCNTRFILMLVLEQQMKLVYVCQFSNNRGLKISMYFLNILDVLFYSVLFCFVIKKEKVLTYLCHDFPLGVPYTVVHHFHHESLPYVLFRVILSEGHDNPAVKIV